jgi:hypothetical protein
MGSSTAPAWMEIPAADPSPTGQGGVHFSAKLTGPSPRCPSVQKAEIVSPRPSGRGSDRLRRFPIHDFFFVP